MGDPAPPDDDARARELQELRGRLAEAEETLHAIRHGEVDALLITDGKGDRVYTLRSADAPYRALVEHMQEGVATVSTRGEIIYANERFAKLVGRSLERVIGQPLDGVVEPAHLATLRGLIAEGTGSLRTCFRSAEGTSVEAQISVSRVTVDGTEHRTLIVTDVSALTTAQRENQSKDEFLAMLAHELRNPLGAVGGAVEVLGLVDLPDPRAQHARVVIERQTAHMARLVDDLLDVGRVVTGKIVLERKRLDLAETVRSSVEPMSAEGRSEGSVALSLTPVWVSADPVRLEQIVGNLVSNALKFSAGKPVEVSVRADGAHAVLEVTDRGLGIDPPLLPRIFDLFVQADDTIDRARGGLGIGLTLVRRLVELHDGTVEAFSEGRDQGSRFIVRLPASEPPARAARGGSAGPRARPQRVLLVDDNADLREMFSIVLQVAGHEVHEAEHGKDALAMIRETAFDVAIIDIGLPGMDGYEVARRIRAEPGGDTLALFALTGYGLPEDMERSRAAGFDRHLVKPVSPDELRRELADVAERGGEGPPQA